MRPSATAVRLWIPTESVVLICILASVCTALQAQTGLDDVHVATRTPAILADAHYSGALGRAGLIRSSVDLVLVPVTITDAQDRPVVGLDRENFRVFENKRPQDIKNFSSEDAPVSLGIILDISGSMHDKIERARDAVTEFCETANPQDEFFLITFADVPRVATDFTSSPARLENDLLATRPAGQTALLDAIYLGLQKMREAHYPRKALLVISDGGDNHSRYDEREVKAAIKEADVMVYAVGTYDRYFRTTEEELGPELLHELAGITGGQAFTVENPNELSIMTRKVGLQLRYQYMLAYRPQSASRDGKWHKINVKLSLSKQAPFLHVRAKEGYYARGQ